MNEGIQVVECKWLPDGVIILRGVSQRLVCVDPKQLQGTEEVLVSPTTYQEFASIVNVGNEEE